MDEQKKLFYLLHLITIIAGLGIGISKYQDKEKVKNEVNISLRYQIEFQKIICNEQSRLELSSLVIPAIKSKNQTNEQKDDLEKIKELASKNNKNKYKNLAEFSLSINNDNLKIFVKKYPDFSNLEFRDRELSVNLNQISADWENFSRELRMGGNQFLQSRCNASR